MTVIEEKNMGDRKDRFLRAETQAGLEVIHEKLGVSSARPSKEDRIERFLSASQMEEVATKGILLGEREYMEALRRFLDGNTRLRPELYLDPMPCGVTGRNLAEGEIFWMTDILGCVGLEVSLGQAQDHLRAGLD